MYILEWGKKSREKGKKEVELTSKEELFLVFPRTGSNKKN